MTGQTLLYREINDFRGGRWVSPQALRGSGRNGVQKLRAGMTQRRLAWTEVNEMGPASWAGIGNAASAWLGCTV